MTVNELKKQIEKELKELKLINNYDKDYIISLLKKKEEDLEATEIAEIQEAAGLDWVCFNRIANLFDLASKTIYSDIKLAKRAKLELEGKKFTETYLEDLANIDPEWIDWFTNGNNMKAEANKYRKKEIKWEEKYKAKMDLQATNRRINVL